MVMSDSELIAGVSKTYCCVPQCKNAAWNSKNLSFHVFPRVTEKMTIADQEKAIRRRIRWIIALRMGKPVSDTMVVCSSHFRDFDFFPKTSANQTKRWLKKNAVPSLNLPVPETEAGNKNILQATQRRMEADERYDSKSKLPSKRKNLPRKRTKDSQRRKIASEISEEVDDKLKNEDTVVSDSIEEFNEIKPDTSFLTDESISSFNSDEAEQNIDWSEDNMLPLLKEDEAESNFTSDIDEVMSSVSENNVMASEELKLKVDKLTECYKKSQKQLKKCQKQCKLYEKEIVSLREVISSLKQIISVSNEKFFEVES